MLIDYLRYVAFAGYLSSFFAKGLEDYVDPADTTGQHLRYSPDHHERYYHWYNNGYFDHRYLNGHEELLLERLKRDLGLRDGPDASGRPNLILGGSPAIFAYTELVRPKLEIIIDIDPKRWSTRYIEPRTYEETPILYRRVGAARGNATSGQKLVDGNRPSSQFGTICGFFTTKNAGAYALTCGHVVAAGSKVRTAKPRKLWRFNLGSQVTALGETRYHATCLPRSAIEPVRTALDAALVSIDTSVMGDRTWSSPYLVGPKPISTILQEDQIRFRGASRMEEILARVTAVTVRKSMDLHKDGTLYDVGDVLMLGHRQRMYVAQYVSHDGDSGAAVREDLRLGGEGQYRQRNLWLGMVLGSDDAGAYATHAEHLWAWAAQSLDNSELEFAYDI